jgi:uncharacterized protein YndB with AHSA1/START domain
MTADRIEREITIAASIERVWAVLTEPELVSAWFSTGKPAEIDLRPGGIMRLNHGEGYDFPMRIVRVDPPRRLAYRWASAYPGEDATEANSTLVEFTLTQTGAGTRLRLVESGFASLAIPPDRVRTAGYDSHAQGWTGKLDELRQYAQRLAV